MKKKKVWLRLGAAVLAAVLCFGTLCACNKAVECSEENKTFALTK